MDMKNKLKTYERSVLWKKFAGLLRKKNAFPGMKISIAGKNSPFYEPRWIHLIMCASYDTLFEIKHSDLISPSVILEFCTSKEVPLEPISLRLNSMLQTFLEEKRMLYQFKRNIPTVYCTHPMITLIQKISDGIVNRFQRPVESIEMPPYASGLRGKIPPFDPRIIRHYEDAAAIILNIQNCYPLGIKSKMTYEVLFKELMERRMVRRKLDEGITIHNHQSLLLIDEERTKLLQLCQQQRFCLYYQSTKKKNLLIHHHCKNVQTSLENGLKKSVSNVHHLFIKQSSHHLSLFTFNTQNFLLHFSHIVRIHKIHFYPFHFSS